MELKYLLDSKLDSNNPGFEPYPYCYRFCTIKPIKFELAARAAFHHLRNQKICNKKYLVKKYFLVKNIGVQKFVAHIEVGGRGEGGSFHSQTREYQFSFYVLMSKHLVLF